MSTVGAIIDRLYRTYLYPPDARPAQAHLDTAINTTVTSVILKGFVLPEDEELLGVGSVLEIGSELMQVTAYDELTLTATVLRGVMGTTAATAAVDDPVLLNPPYPRLSVFNAVADNILTLYPTIYTVTAANLVTVTAGIAAIDDTLAVEVVECWPDGFNNDRSAEARIVDYHPAVGGRALIADASGDLWVRYRRRFGDAQTEADTLTSLGMEERWVNIVVVGAAADLFAGRDLPASHTEWVSGALEAENIPVGTRGQLSRQLAAYRSYLLDHAGREMRAEYKATTRMRKVASVSYNSPFG